MHILVECTHYNALTNTVVTRSVQRHPWRRKMRHRNPWGNKEDRGDKIYYFLFQGKISVDVYV